MAASLKQQHQQLHEQYVSAPSRSGARKYLAKAMSKIVMRDLERSNRKKRR
jgi:hypothetical protein